MEVQATGSGSSERDGLILTGVLPEAVVFKWDLEGVKWVEKGHNEIPFITG